MIRRISNLTFPVLLFSIMALLLLIFILIYRGQTIVTGLFIVIVVVLIMRNFTSIRIEDEKLSIKNYHLFKNDCKVVYLREIKEFRIIVNNRMITIPGTNSRSKADRIIENETFELIAIDNNEQVIRIINSSRFQRIYKIAKIISKHYSKPIYMYDKALRPIKKGFFKGFNISDAEENLTTNN